MKVVLFCGGQGTRLRGHSQNVPKPMVRIGSRPILWHVMKYYAHYGHKDFILCLGYMAEVIKDYFLNYDECLSNNFVMSEGGKRLQLLNSDIQDWNITFVDTGLHTNVGQRLKAVEPYLEGDEIFLANYSDGLTDFPLPRLIANLREQKKTGTFLSVKPPQSFHLVWLHEDGVVRNIQHVEKTDLRINGGFFVFTKNIFRYIAEGDDLIEGPFEKLVAQRQMAAIKYDGFWTCMDTFKDKQRLETLYGRGTAPWEVWKSAERAQPEKPVTVREKTNGKPAPKLLRVGV